jgi:membrane protein implicated in regulation of membrane protease activity
LNRDILLLLALAIILAMSYYEDTDALLITKNSGLPISPTMGTIIAIIAVAVLAFLVLRKRIEYANSKNEGRELKEQSTELFEMLGP